MVEFRLFPAVIWIALATSVIAACDRQEPGPAREQDAGPARKEVGHHVMRLSVSVGSIWGGGYLVDVATQDYALVEHANCPEAKEETPINNSAKGLCVVRITKQQSDLFESAMERFKPKAVPLESYSFDDPFFRPDGKPCRNKVTDSTLISLMWSGTEGVKLAQFYMGCDVEEFGSFYRSVLKVTDPLPIQHIIGKR